MQSQRERDERQEEFKIGGSLLNLSVVMRVNLFFGPLEVVIPRSRVKCPVNAA